METSRERTKHTPTPYQIGQVHGSEGRQWSVGKDNSATEVFYFDTPLDAVHKLMMLRGRDFVINALNAHDELVAAGEEVLVEWATPLVTGESFPLRKLEAALDKAEGRK